MTKGATKVILEMCSNKDQVRDVVLGANLDLANRGFRSLGVAKTRPNTDDWVFTGVLSLFDPPRVDTKDTIETAYTMGVDVKMITGDQTAIAIETCKNISIGTYHDGPPKILDMKDFLAAEDAGLAAAKEIVKNSDGFAEVRREGRSASASPPWGLPPPDCSLPPLSLSPPRFLLPRTVLALPPPPLYPPQRVSLLQPLTPGVPRTQVSNRRAAPDAGP